MHEYDTAFKLTLQHVDVTFRELLGSPITRWHNVEFCCLELSGDSLIAFFAVD